MLMRYTNFGNTGQIVSKLGLGGAQFGIYNSKITKEEGGKVIRRAFDAGINYFDTAPFYGYDTGQSEKTFAEGLKGIDRKSYFMATKVGRYERNILKMIDFSAEKTKASVRKSLQHLKTDYIDLVQIHDFEYSDGLDVVVKETLPTLDEMRRKGKIKYIGLASYSLPKIRCLLDLSPVKIDAVLNHSCLTLIDQKLAKYVDFFKKKQVAIINASILAHGLLSNGPLPDFVSEIADEQLVAATRRAVEIAGENGYQIERLAYGYSSAEGERLGVDVLLTGADNVPKLEANLKTFLDGLKSHELQFCHQLQREIFANLKVRNWVDADVADFKKKLKLAKAGIAIPI